MTLKNPRGFDTDELQALVKYDIEKGDIEKALTKVKEILTDKNPPTEIYAILARLYAQLGLFERAKDNFTTYLKSHPEASVERFQLGIAHFDCGENQEALSIWDALLEKEPIHPPTLFYRSLVLAQSGKLAEAKQSIDILLKSTAVDNLYYSRAKELLQEINTGRTQKNNKSEGHDSVMKVIPKDAYQS